MANKASVLIVSGESGDVTLQEDLRIISQAKGLTPEDLRGTLKVSVRLPKLDDGGQVEDLIDHLKETGCTVLFLDPLYRSIRVGADASNIYAMGERLENLAEKIHRAGITVILLHHFRKQGNYAKPGLEDLSQSGIAEFTRQFILLKRKEQYEEDGRHNLWITWGGSAGHQGTRIMEAYTGTQEAGKSWEVTLRTPTEQERFENDRKAFERKSKAEERAGSTLAAVVEWLEEIDGPFTRSGAVSEIPGRDSEVRQILTDLERRGVLTKCKNRRLELVEGWEEKLPDYHPRTITVDELL